MKSKTDEIHKNRLYTRSQARLILGGVCDPTLRRLEKTGALTPIRLNKHSPTAQAYYRGADIRRLVDGE